MVETMILTNQDIYEKAIGLTQNLSTEDLMLPVKVGFYLNKNIQTLLSLGQEIENEREKIYNTYGEINEESSQYEFKNEDIETVNKEISDLFSLEQEVDIYKINLELFDNITLSPSQISLISFMIEEE